MMNTSPETRFRCFVEQRRYIYHIVTFSKLTAIVRDGCIRSRNLLSHIHNDYALQDLIVRRNAVQLPNRASVHDAVPFYLTPRQPMFCRLIREKKIAPEDVIAIGFDFTTLNVHFLHWLFTSNPAYPESCCIGSWHARHQLDWEVLQKWRWNNDTDSKEEKRRLSAIRQAELLVQGMVPLATANHLIVQSHTHTQWIQANVHLSVNEIEGIFEW